MNNKCGMSIAAIFLLSGLGLGAHQVVEAKPLQQASSKVKPSKPVAPKPRPKSISKKPPRSLFQMIRTIFQPPKLSPLGSRNSHLCAIAPGRLEKGNDTIWSDRPIFFWRGRATGLKLFDEETGELLWEKSLSGNEQSLAYDGPALTPGQVYEWRLVNDGMMRTTFQVMAAGPRAQMNAALQGLVASEEIKSLPLEAQQPVLRSQYFDRQGLMSDALESLQGVSQLSEELKTIFDEGCGWVKK